MATNLLDITETPRFDESIIKREFHTYAPFIESFNNNDQIRISIQNQDLCVLPSDSFICIEGTLLTVPSPDNNSDSTSVSELCNNCVAFLFDEIRYELNGVEIDRCRNVGISSTLKNYASLNPDEFTAYQSAGWVAKLKNTPTDGNFNICIPLKLLLGFAEDYRKIIANARHELILIRAKSDDSAVVTRAQTYQLHINKLLWKVPHINLSDSERLKLYKTIQSSKPIQMAFRSWDLYEYPNLPRTTHFVWTVKTSAQLEKPRYVLLALQENSMHNKTTDPSKFNSCKLTNVKVHLNSETYPNDNLNVSFEKNRYGLLYDLYCRFQESYYGRRTQPLLNWSDFKALGPIVVIDCSHQNETIKNGPVDVRVEFETETDGITDSTSAYCLLIHDRIIEYTPFSGDVRKLI